MESLTPTFSFNVSSMLGVNNIRLACVLNKNRLCKCTIIGNKQPQNKERAHQSKKQCKLIRAKARRFT